MTQTPTTRRVDLDITGMTCASCVGRVERKLGKLEGVTASVNLPLESAAVTAPSSVTDEELVAAVDRAGYTATLRRAPSDPAPTQVTSARHSVPEEGEGHDHSDQAAHGEHSDHSDHSDHLNHGPSGDVIRPRLIGAAILTIPLFLVSMVPALQFPHWGWVALVLATPVTFWSAWPFHTAAFKAARHGSSTMDTLVSIGVLAAWSFSTVELLLDPGMTAMAGAAHGGGMASMADHQLYFETAGVVTTFLLLGRWLEARAKKQAGAALKSLLDLGAKTATVLRDGVETTVPAAELVPGDEFVVRPGEKVATDGYVVAGHSAVDTSVVTGESVPEEVGPEDTVTGATVNTSGRLLVRATRTGSDTTLAQMGRLVSDAQTGKAPIARLADRISAVFVPIVLVIAVITFALWLLLSGDLHAAFRAAVAVLVIACPCALGLATPVGLLAGTGRASQLGILIRGPEVLEDTRTVDTIVLDKTGTVTAGDLAVTSVTPLDGHDAGHLLLMAGAVEAHSEHPIATAITAAAREANGGTVPDVDGFESAAGGGVRGTVLPHTVAAGRSSYIVTQLNSGALTAEQEQRLAEAEQAGATAVWISVDGRVAGIISLQDTVKESSAPAVAEFKRLGLRPILLTGDNAAVAAQVAAAVGISPEDVFAGVRPEDKVARVTELQRAGRVVAMVGDGVNDAPALAQADLGIAMGSGTDVAREAADITVMGSSLGQVVQSVQLSRKTLGIIKSNLFWAFAYNTIGIPVAAVGLLNPMLAGAAMALSSVLVVANSLRLTRFAR
ncbi:heavy metal translocating P-type ATPase [Citricoccus sp. I39-566]|uniref:heavy metal translocating P-type ATPase n=1 Tax=Citricoccus sp. I39-566 TaxID=3073268 RepID=UPI00286C8E6A|nr:heavy metal translocating P-type ATPase [Citricoccus sp. I39-566]WMY78654.1 heavy metal translocating P-type ATPase [Citricoccus sp. I39-566]